MSDSVHRIGVELRESVARLYTRFRSQRADGQLGDAAVAVLTGLQKNGPMTLTDLSARAMVTAGSMSQTVNRLVDGGYVERAKDPADGRRVMISLTAIGLEHAVAARAVREGWLDSQIEALTMDERATLLAATEIIKRIASA